MDKLRKYRANVAGRNYHKPKKNQKTMEFSEIAMKKLAAAGLPADQLTKQALYFACSMSGENEKLRAELCPPGCETWDLEKEALDAVMESEEFKAWRLKLNTITNDLTELMEEGSKYGAGFLLLGVLAQGKENCLSATLAQGSTATLTHAIHKSLLDHPELRVPIATALRMVELKETIEKLGKEESQP